MLQPNVTMALLGMDLTDTGCEKACVLKCHLTKQDGPTTKMVKPGLAFAAGPLASPHWTSPVIKHEDRNVKHLLKRHVHEIDEVQAHIDDESHELHFQVLMRHKKRLISVYKAIADDHNFKTLVRINRKPSKA